MRMNPRQIIQLMQQGQSPEQIAMSLLKMRMGNNPMAQNLLALAEQGRSGDLEQIARNLAEQQGIDFDKEFSSFKHTLGF